MQRARRQVLSLLDDKGSVIFDQTKLMEMAVCFFQKLYTQDTEPLMLQTNYSFLPLSATSHACLCACPDLNEIHKAVMSMAPSKAPGVDVFRLLFTKNSGIVFKLIFWSWSLQSLLQVLLYNTLTKH